MFECGINLIIFFFTKMMGILFSTIFAHICKTI